VAAPESPDRKRGRLWLTIGEVAAVLGLVIAALNYWDTHREHVEKSHLEAAQARQASRGAAFVLEAAPEGNGRRLGLKAVEPSQVIQSQRYVFPRAVLGHPVDVTAAVPRIEAAWIAPGLDRALAAAHATKAGLGRLPVAVVTVYVENGETRQDRSLYVVGYGWQGHFLGGRAISLQGLALQRRAVTGDLQAQVDRLWMTIGQPSGVKPT
jgi:hypothetical protein